MVEGLVEREAETEALLLALERARSGTGRAIGLEGSAGIGKTALLGVLRQEALDRQVRVLTASSTPLEQDFPFGVARQLLERPLRDLDEPARGRVLAGPAVLGATTLDLAPDPPGTPEVRVGPGLGELAAVSLAGMHLRVHGLFWVVANLCALGPVLVVVDDVPWTDPASLHLLSYLARRVADLPLLLAVSWRTGEPSTDPEAFEALTTALDRTTVRPRPLSVKGVHQLLETTVPGGATAAAAQHLHAQTGGNPFLVREVAHSRSGGGTGPSWEGADDQLVLPATVSRAILRRLRALGPDAGLLARAVLVLGDGCGLAEAAEVAGLGPGPAEAAAAALTRGELLARSGTLELVHGLVRSALEADLSPAERSAWHRRAARALTRRSAATDRIVAQLLHSTPTGSAADLRLLHEAGQQALRKGAAAEAGHLLRRALDEGPGPTEVGGVLADLGRSQVLTDELDEAATTLTRARSLSQDSSTLATRTVLLWTALLAAGRIEEGVALLESTIASLTEDVDDPPDGHRDDVLMLESELVVAALFRPERLPVASRRLTRYGRLMGSTPGERRLLSMQTLVAQQTAGRSAAEVARLAHRALSGRTLVAENVYDSTKWVWPLGALIITDRLPDAERMLEVAHEVVREAGFEEASVLLADLHSWLRLRQGRLVEAEDEALDGLLRVAELPRTSVRELLTIAMARWAVQAFVARGRSTEADRLLVRLGLDGELPVGSRSVKLYSERGALRLEQRRYAEALDCAMRLRRFEEEHGLDDVMDGPWRPVAARALAGLGDRSAAVELAEDQLRLVAAWDLPRDQGQALRTRALVESDPGRRVDLLREAVAVYGRAPSSYALAAAEADLGTALVRARRVAEGVPVLLRAHEGARSSGADGLAAAVQVELGLVGARPRSRRAVSADALTTAERRVVRLVVAGLSNREVAQELFVSVRTVENTLHRVYQRLGVRSRRDLARAVHGAMADDPG